MYSKNTDLRRFLAIFAVLFYSSVGMNKAFSAKVERFEPTGEQPVITLPSDKEKKPYSASYALLIAQSSYLGLGKSGWAPLPNTIDDARKLGKILQSQGFFVTLVSDANRHELDQHLTDFSVDFGTDPNNRLFYFYSGHGHSLGDSGYIVPIDAPNPKKDPKGFLKSAIPIRYFESISHDLGARHAMFVFDSCFSGTIFNTKGTDLMPDDDEDDRSIYLANDAQQPSRFFLTAGGPDETVPAKSEFLPILIHALTGSGNSLRDGYVTSEQIGAYVAERVPNNNRSQNPQYGTLRYDELNRGKIVFQYSKSKSKLSNDQTARKLPKFLKSSTYSTDLYFDFDSSVLNLSNKEIADEFINEVGHGNIKIIEITGFADKREKFSQAYGIKVGERRAYQVREYLLSKGLTSSLIYFGGRYISEAKSDADLDRSRRATIMIELEPKSVAP